jgi:hypothetical protein
MTARLIQAYQQAPWRIQVQRFGKVMLGLVGLVIVAGLYLNITALAASSGLRIKELNNLKEESNRKISDLNSQLAYLTSAQVMDARAAELGFELVSNTNALYIVLPGYIGRQPVQLAPAPSTNTLPRPIIKPAYTESLWDWLTATFLGSGDSSEGSSP